MIVSYEDTKEVYGAGYASRRLTGTLLSKKPSPMRSGRPSARFELPQPSCALKKEETVEIGREGYRLHELLRELDQGKKIFRMRSCWNLELCRLIESCVTKLCVVAFFYRSLCVRVHGYHWAAWSARRGRSRRVVSDALHRSVKKSTSREPAPSQSLFDD